MLIAYECQVKIRQINKTVKYSAAPGILPERGTRVEPFFTATVGVQYSSNASVRWCRTMALFQAWAASVACMTIPVRDLFEYIESFYGQKRMHATLAI
jgi:hypothetical protein